MVSRVKPYRDSRSEKDTRLKVACKSYFGSYVSNIQFAATHGLPHLDLLDWKDSVDMGKEFFEAVIKFPAQHVLLSGIGPSTEFQVGLPPELVRGGDGWPLRSLHMHLGYLTGRYKWVSTLPLVTSLLRLCAPTLESLTLRCDKEDPSPAQEWDLTLPPFPKLRDLRITGSPRDNISTIVEALVPTEGKCRLRSLSIPVPEGPIADALTRRGRIASLERLNWVAFSSITGIDGIEFVLANYQLSGLSLSEAPSELTIRYCLVCLRHLPI